jgi:hypothetical protein
MKYIGRILLFIVLTALTQVGGVIYLLSIPLFLRLSTLVKSKLAKAGVKIITFIATYFILSFTLVPIIAQIFGRVPLPIAKPDTSIHPNSIMTCLLNRHYVRKELYEVVKRATAETKLPIYYLDASFPFINGFPLLPHWSHNDGKKIDLTYYYTDKQNSSRYEGSPSWLGYGFCEEPAGNEVCTACECARQGYKQYDLLRHLVPASLHSRYEVNASETERLIRTIADDPSVSMIFIEPHLKQRWGLSDIAKIRFHGCHAVRHDDHIHIQIR